MMEGYEVAQKDPKQSELYSGLRRANQFKKRAREIRPVQEPSEEGGI